MDINQLTLLVVDDMHFSRESLRISLGKCGITDIHTAENALQALKAVDKFSPDVILVDKMMPKVDGPKLISKIRAKDEEKDSHTYIILLTADESENALRDAMLSGADHYLYKDAGGEKIINCIEYIDTQFRAQQILKELEQQEKNQREASEQPVPPTSTATEAAAPEPMPQGETNHDGPSPQDLSCILVDDEDFSAEHLQRLMNKLKVSDVRVAKNALEALKQHKKEPADFMLVDYMMPKVDGIKLTEMIREFDRERGRFTPIVMITAAASLKKIEEAIKAGVDEYLYKPPSAHDLVQRIEAAFKKHNPESPLAQANWASFF
ncbi:response regulator receiver domain protein [gamma proteobacterium HTCC5015]|nr:response regulator receiver domain protein [gamma proteobacterium HTCC5015]